MSYAVHVLLWVDANGVSTEATVEEPTLYRAVKRIHDAAETHPSFLAITLVHAEELPTLLEGATSTERPPA